MRILFLASDLDETNGWGRYAAGFIAEAAKRLPPGSTTTATPETLRSSRLGLAQLLWVLVDAFRLKEEAARHDLIHALSEPVAPLAMAVSLLSGKPYLVSVHGTYGDLRSYPPSLRWLYRAAFGRAAFLAPVSGYTAAVVRRSFPDARLEVIPGGFTPSASPKKMKTIVGRKILSVGALKQRKGFHTLIRALEILHRSGFATDCDIVGSMENDDYHRRLQAMIDENGLGKWIRLRGKVREEELQAMYEDADLFVLAPEHDGTAFEGLGLVYLEALSHGIPAIGSRDSGAEDVIKDGINGFLVPPGKPEELAAAIRCVLGDQTLWHTLASKAPLSVEAFRWDVVGRRMHELYERIGKPSR